jgi:serine/threonine protein kinase
MTRQQAWEQDRSPAGILAPSEHAPSGRGLVSEFVELWARGAGGDARDFLARHPRVKADKSLVLDLAYEEYCCRKEAGDPPDADEFCARYPAYQASLRRLIEAHQFLEASSPAPDGETACPLQAGDTVLGFTLLRELGRGAFARVFLASEAALGNRPVAVKFGREGATEAKTLGRLRHPNIVPVYSVQQDPRTGLTAVCMPFAGSATLCDVLDRAFAGPGLPARARVILEAARDGAPAEGALDREAPDRLLIRGTYVEGVVHLGALLAGALAFTHSEGILHRDLKPSNVLVTPAGRPMLLDFNLSFDDRLAEERLGGTLPYMAPEHLRATDPALGFDPSLVDARSDIFSLGVILYELLTGAHPFGRIPASLSPAEVRAHLLRRQQAGPESVRRANPQVAPALARVIESCLALDSDNRPESAAALAVALRKYLSPWRRVGRRAVRHGRAVAAITVVLLVVGSAAAYQLSRREPSHLAPLRAGVEAYRQERYADAEGYFRRAADAAPDNPAVCFALARARQKQAVRLWIQGHEDNEKLFGAAVFDFARLATMTQDARLHLCLGFCHNLLPNHPQAIAEYEAAISAGLRSAAAYNNLGYSYLQRNAAEDLQVAHDCLDKAINANPNLAAAYHNRAWVHWKKSVRSGTAKEARQAATESMIADLKKATALTRPCPEAAEFYADAARLYAWASRQDDGRLDEARRLGRLAIANGQNPAAVNKALCGFNPRLEPLSAAPGPRPPASALHTLRVVDPLEAIPPESLFGE